MCNCVEFWGLEFINSVTLRHLYRVNYWQLCHLWRSSQIVLFCFFQWWELFFFLPGPGVVVRGFPVCCSQCGLPTPGLQCALLFEFVLCHGRCFPAHHRGHLESNMERSGEWWRPHAITLVILKQIQSKLAKPPLHVICICGFFAT